MINTNSQVNFNGKVTEIMQKPNDQMRNHYVSSAKDDGILVDSLVKQLGQKNSYNVDYDAAGKSCSVCVGKTRIKMDLEKDTLTVKTQAKECLGKRRTDKLQPFGYETEMKVGRDITMDQFSKLFTAIQKAHPFGTPIKNIMTTLVDAVNKSYND